MATILVFQNQEVVAILVFQNKDAVAILVFQNREAAAILVYETNPLGIEHYFYANKMLYSLTDLVELGNLQNSWPLTFCQNWLDRLDSECNKYNSHFRLSGF